MRILLIFILLAAVNLTAQVGIGPSQSTSDELMPGNRKGHRVKYVGAALNLTWTDNADNETGFLVERSTNGTDFSQIADIAPNSQAFTDNDNLSHGTGYWYRVRAYNAAGNSGYSNTASGITATP